MIDITRKRVSLRHAAAEARVALGPGTAEAILEGRVPKGGVVDVTRSVALLAIKRTPDLLPFCHPIPIERGHVEISVHPAEVVVRVEVDAIARTGVEVEAMTGASVAALNVYDMIKPIDGTACIRDVRLVEKRGGKSDLEAPVSPPPRAGILVASDSVSAGRAKDGAGAAVGEALRGAGVEVAAFEVVPDDEERIASTVKSWCDESGLDLVLVVGGTGLGPRDRTPEALRPLLERELPGLGEAIRAHGRERTARADLSRALAGQRGTSLVLGLAGSTRAAREAMDALLPWLLHVLKVMDEGYRHDS